MTVLWKLMELALGLCGEKPIYFQEAKSSSASRRFVKLMKMATILIQMPKAISGRARRCRAATNVLIAATSFHYGNSRLLHQSTLAARRRLALPEEDQQALGCFACHRSPKVLAADSWGDMVSSA